MAALLALFLLVAGSIVGSSQAVEYVVGDSTGWRVPSFFQHLLLHLGFWQKLHLFNFATGAHDVAIVTEDACENCNTANPINQTNTGPARITLTNDTDNYFICTTAPADRNWRLMSMQQPTLPHPHPHPAHHPALHPHHRLPVRPPLLLLHSSSPCRP
ncbi:umecyanin-like [Tripterygium wilfordii]|uniref:Umecyanin-like n=1 Tax=Tripterygium wilfordii TaxID=458696 RepID=A0A7J7D6S2_TRIWF|nr:umecyanin-like [Tripterygium wilfordii]